MGYLYSTMSPFYNTRTITFSTAHINMYPTATGVVYDNNAFNDLPEDEKHYLISASELKELGICVDERGISIHGRTAALFYKEQKHKKKTCMKNIPQNDAKKHPKEVLFRGGFAAFQPQETENQGLGVYEVIFKLPSSIFGGFWGLQGFILGCLCH